jgi:nucleotide-binding universal stress UspA family protein
MAIFNQLLVPVDGSAPSEAAVSLALRLAAEQHAAVTFVNVVEVDKIVASMTPGQGFADPGPAISALREAGTALIAECRKRSEAAGVTATAEMLDGDAVQTIVECVKRHHADLIVIGSHGRGGVQRLLLGSVAEGVLRHTRTPILICRAERPRP